MTKINKLTPLQTHLASIGACADARLWAGDRSPSKAWKECDNPRWLFWRAGCTAINSHQSLVLAACACVRAALVHVPKGELRPLRAVEAAERWAKDPTKKHLEQCREAAAAARVAWAAAGAVARVAWEAEAVTELCQIIRTVLKCPYNKEKL